MQIFNLLGWSKHETKRREKETFSFYSIVEIDSLRKGQILLLFKELCMKRGHWLKQRKPICSKIRYNKFVDKQDTFSDLTFLEVDVLIHNFKETKSAECVSKINIFVRMKACLVWCPEITRKLFRTCLIIFI